MFIDYRHKNKPIFTRNQFLGLLLTLVIVITLPLIITTTQTILSRAANNNTQMPVETTYIVASPNDIVNEIGGKLIFGNNSFSNILGTGVVADQSYLGMRFTGGVVRRNSPILSAKIVFTTSRKSQQQQGFSLFGASHDYVRFSYGVVDTIAAQTFSNTNTPSLIFTQLKNTTISTVSPIDEKDVTFNIDVTKQVTQVMNLPGRPIDMPIEFVFKGYGDAQKRVFFYSTQTPDKAPRLIVTYQFVPETPQQINKTQQPIYLPTATPTPLGKPTPTPNIIFPTSRPSSTLVR